MWFQWAAGVACHHTNRDRIALSIPFPIPIPYTKPDAGAAILYPYHPNSYWHTPAANCQPFTN
jgi:hypothetical protein